ncbi:hypothetical protein O6P43_004175 [Quillaja saponaria]|uniref:Uncharacterized protein n=1 Tax=Quillaja saponaria TaxID=32244 RepID=A0AAD7Q346_QUISA|nr:hypothetical protein O6P43_004175 [Quillaja saponaria]
MTHEVGDDHLELPTVIDASSFDAATKDENTRQEKSEPQMKRSLVANSKEHECYSAKFFESTKLTVVDTKQELRSRNTKVFA